MGPRIAGQSANGANDANGANGANGADSGVEICVLDADDVLDNPTGMIEAYCKSTGIKYEPEMLKWKEEHHQKYAREVFEKWRGWHEDAINSEELKARTHVSGFFLVLGTSRRSFRDGRWLLSGVLWLCFVSRLP